MEGLKENVMINQFVLVAGCPRDQAAKILSQAGWQFQTALSIYFQEAVIPKNNASLSLLTPANTPATPPNFPDTLNLFSNMSTSDSSSRTSGGSSGTIQSVTSSLSPRGRHHLHQSSRYPGSSGGTSGTSLSSNNGSSSMECQFQLDNGYLSPSNNSSNSESGSLRHDMY